MATGRTRLKFFLQLVVVSGLVYQLTSYSMMVLEKAKENRVVMAVKEVPTDDFKFPTVAICFTETDEEEMITFGPVAFVRHYLMVNETYGRFVAVGPHDPYDPEFGISPAQLWSLSPPGTRKVLPCIYYTPPQNLTTPPGLKRVLAIGLDSSFLSHGYKSMGYQITLNRLKWMFFWQVFGTTMLQLHGPAAQDHHGDENHLTRVVKLPIKFSQKSSLPTEERPCTIGSGVDDIFQPQECLNRFFYDHIECVADFSSCTQRDFDRIEDLRGEMNELEYEELTGCGFPCTMEKFEVGITADLTVSKTVAFDAFGRDWMDSDEQSYSQFHRADLILNFFVAMPYKTEEEEYYVYDAAAAVGDIGGMLGMLLGASFLTCFEFVFDQSCHAWDWLGGKRKDGSKRKRSKSRRSGKR